MHVTLRQSFRDLLVAASLKPKCWKSLCYGVARFRDLLVAASLKLQKYTPSAGNRLKFPRSFGRGLIEAISHAFKIPWEETGFRDLLVAASLKPATLVDLLEHTDDCFRDLLVAASLKRFGENADAGVELSGFPRSFGRGLIEATSTRFPISRELTRFPRSFGRGLIEASRPRRGGPRRRRTFPRSFGRGLIEASLVAWIPGPRWEVSAIFWSRPH